MTTTTQETTRPKRWRSRKIAAILAGGLVLGVGATYVLAAWNDSEFATGTFSAGQFNMVGSTDGTAFSDHASAGAAATLPFTVNVGSLSPTDVAAAPFAVRLTAPTTNNATVTVTSAGTTGTVTNLTYTLLQTTAFGCTATTTGTALVPTGTALTSTGGTAVTFNLTKGTGGAAGTAVNLCFQVTAGAITQGQTGTATWQFAAQSV